MEKSEFSVLMMDSLIYMGEVIKLGVLIVVVF